MKRELFVPSPELEPLRLEAIEYALSEGGIVDGHMRWVDIATEQGQEKAPTADIGIELRKAYGYLPERFTADAKNIPKASARPSREPIDFTLLATSKLGLDYDAPYDQLVSKAIVTDEGWFKFLVDHAVLDPETVEAMKQAAYQAYRLDALTEDNLPTYVCTNNGGFIYLAKDMGLLTPATEEWNRGIWSAEENKHKEGMNEYGKILSITNTREHYLGVNSQLRAGMEIELQHVIQIFTYVAWQELSTNYAHKNNAELFGPLGSTLLSEIAGDEARHHWVYMSVVQALAKKFPDDVVRTVENLLIKPNMPGNRGIPDFRRQALDIHRSGIFTREHGNKAAKVVASKLGYLKEDFDTSWLTTEGIAALQHLREHFGTEPSLGKESETAFVLGKTATIRMLDEARRQYEEEIGLKAA